MPTAFSFILPRSFKKPSLQRHFPSNFHLLCEYDVPAHSFVVENNTHDVPCVFQIWVKKDVPRAMPVKYIPRFFAFVKKHEPHDISFRRVGVYAGTIDRDTGSKSTETHYFIKFGVPLTDGLVNELGAIEYAGKDHTVGPRSIGKQEVIQGFNPVLESHGATT